VAPIPRLSPEDIEDVPAKLQQIRNEMTYMEAPLSEAACLQAARDLAGTDFPSIRMGLETAFLDWLHGGKYLIFENDFHRGEKALPINGLVWMSEKQDMIRQIDDKLAAGFDCIKLKVGALNFEQELEVLHYLRQKAPDVTVRLDANGAFQTNEVLQKLKKLSDFQIHSIEQPIAPRQEEAMKLVIEKSPIPVALDEELISIYGHEKQDLLDTLKPPYLVLKPTLLGGFEETQDWIALAGARGIDWWITSYLESDIGLNAIAQFTAGYDVTLPQGLGTGMLYSNNIRSPLHVQHGAITYSQGDHWGDFSS